MRPFTQKLHLGDFHDVQGVLRSRSKATIWHPLGSLSVAALQAPFRLIQWPRHRFYTPRVHLIMWNDGGKLSFFKPIPPFSPISLVVLVKELPPYWHKCLTKNPPLFPPSAGLCGRGALLLPEWRGRCPRRQHPRVQRPVLCIHNPLLVGSYSAALQISSQFRNNSDLLAGESGCYSSWILMCFSRGSRCIFCQFHLLNAAEI